jgi:tRNA pseudouridine38-40 synthase
LAAEETVKMEATQPERPSNKPYSETETAPPNHVRLRLTIAYDGTQYFGWQWQDGQITVQQRVEEALARLFPSGPRVSGSSRTDTGVHAVGMVAHFDVPAAEWRMKPRKLILAVNHHLPEDIRIMAAARARPNFHARFQAVGKQYRYLVWNHPAHHPLLRNQSWHVPWKLNLAAMKAGARALVGRHDFLGFSSTPGYERKHTIRTVRRCEVRQSGALLTVIIEADGFLYKMCRGIVGTLIQVGIGKFPPEALPEMLLRRDRNLAGMTAPAQGLVLHQVYYRGPVKEAGSDE